MIISVVRVLIVKTRVKLKRDVNCLLLARADREVLIKRVFVNKLVVSN